MKLFSMRMLTRAEKWWASMHLTRCIYPVFQIISQTKNSIETCLAKKFSFIQNTNRLKKINLIRIWDRTCHL